VQGFADGRLRSILHRAVHQRTLLQVTIEPLITGRLLVGIHAAVRQQAEIRKDVRSGYIHGQSFLL
jgi:hypothetical protein